MSISITYKIFPQHDQTIKNLAIQNNIDIFSISSGIQNESIKLYSMKPIGKFEDPLNQQKYEFDLLPGSNQKQNSNTMQWSKDDQYLAVACDKLVIYEMKQNNLNKLWEFKDHILEITSISWSPNSLRIASGGLDGKIVIRDVQEGKKLKEIEDTLQILGLIWDTFDKYLTVLCSDNKVRIWKLSDWSKNSEIDLSFPNDNNKNSQGFISKRQDRKMDQSADYRYTLVPSLDDKVVPIVCALDRQKNFMVIKSYMGPFSSINCVKFNNNLYQQKNIVINVFSMGDNDGNISIWGIGDNFNQKKPFFLLKSHKNGQELIEDIAWSKDGKLMMATTMKKYILMVHFSDDIFGQKLTEQQKQDFIEGQYGGLRTVNQFQQFSVYRSQLEIVENESINNLLLKPQIESNVQAIQKEIIITKQQNIVSKEGKKIIIPQKRVEKIINQNSIPEIIQSIQDPIDSKEKSKEKNPKSSENKQFIEQNSVKLRVPPNYPDNYVLQIPKQSRIIEFQIQKQIENQNESFYTKVKCSQIKNNQKDVIWSDYLQGQLVFIENVSDFLCLYTTKNLIYTIDQQGNKKDLPYMVSKINYMKGNQKGELLTINEHFEMIVSNLIQQKQIIKENIYTLLRSLIDEFQTSSDTSLKELKDPIDSIMLNDNCTPVLYLKNEYAYFFDITNKQWNIMNSNQLFDLGFINKPQNQIVQVQQSSGITQFFEKLILDESQIKQFIISDLKNIAQYEEYLLFIMKYTPQKLEKFQEFSLKYVKMLCDIKEINKLRTFINNMFMNENSKENQFLQIHKINLKFQFGQVLKIINYFPYMLDFCNELVETIKI